MPVYTTASTIRRIDKTCQRQHLKQDIIHHHVSGLSDLNVQLRLAGDLTAILPILGHGVKPLMISLAIYAAIGWMNHGTRLLT
jgi:hypothetical protein